MRASVVLTAAVCVFAIITTQLCHGQGTSAPAPGMNQPDVAIHPFTYVSLSLVIAAVTMALSVGAAGAMLRATMQGIRDAKGERLELLHQMIALQRQVGQHVADASIHTEGGALVLRTDCSNTHDALMEQVRSMASELLQGVDLRVENAVLRAMSRIPGHSPSPRRDA